MRSESLLERLGDFRDLIGIVALSADAFEDGAVSFVGDLTVASEDPKQLAIGGADYGPLIIGVEFQHE